jgi:hypothetical protein
MFLCIEADTGIRNGSQYKYDPESRIWTTGFRKSEPLVTIKMDNFITLLFSGPAEACQTR